MRLRLKWWSKMSRAAAQRSRIAEKDLGLPEASPGALIAAGSSRHHPLMPQAARPAQTSHADRLASALSRPAVPRTRNYSVDGQCQGFYADSVDTTRITLTIIVVNAISVVLLGIVNLILQWTTAKTQREIAETTADAQSAVAVGSAKSSTRDSRSGHACHGGGSRSGTRSTTTGGRMEMAYR